MMRANVSTVLHFAVDARPGANEFSLGPDDDRLVLPPLHQELLRRCNGVEVYAGYYRLFGVGSAAGMDSLVWNQLECWKFAWEDRCSGFWCFGETAWGDQYAYEIESLRRTEDPPVYLLDAFTMTPELLSNSFAEFLEMEFARVAQQPYDTTLRAARERFGPLACKDHLVYVPSPLLGGGESLENVQTMNARSAMICHGDIAVQIDRAPPGSSIRKVETYQDAQHRMRIRLQWDANA